MKRRIGLTLGALFMLNLTGCGILNLLLLPFQLVFSLLGAAASSVGLSDVVPSHGPAPVVQEATDGKWLVSGLRRDAPCTIVCSAPQCDSQTFAWPGDFRGQGEEVAVRLERSR